jgi:hypothetical protein
MNIVSALEESFWIMSVKTDETPKIVIKIDKLTSQSMIDNTAELMSNFHNTTVLITDDYNTVIDYITTNNIDLNGHVIPE